MKGSKNNFNKELEQLKKFVLSSSTENAKDYFVFPLFQKLFGSKFKKQSDASGADIYVEGKLVTELKTKYDLFLQGFYQSLHYSKKGLSFRSICVIANKFIVLWKVDDIPDFAKKYSAESDSQKAANDIGVLNANKTSKAQKYEILKTATFKLDPTDFEGLFQKDFTSDLHEFLQVLKTLDTGRIQTVLVNSNETFFFIV